MTSEQKQRQDLILIVYSRHEIFIVVEKRKVFGRNFFQIKSTGCGDLKFGAKRIDVWLPISRSGISRNLSYFITNQLNIPRSIKTCRLTWLWLRNATQHNTLQKFMGNCDLILIGASQFFFIDLHRSLDIARRQWPSITSLKKKRWGDNRWCTLFFW